MIQGVSPQIESILAAGNHASSNMNCQPWRFVVKGEHIEVHVDTDKDTSPYNSGERLSYFTIGAVVENMTIAASALGYRTNIIYFPEGPSTCVAACELVLEPGIESDPLSPEIFLRITNRKKFLPVKMSDREKQDLISVFSSNPQVHLSLIDERKDVKQLAEIIALDDELIFSSKSLHSFFFSHINWTQQEEASKKDALSIRNLELPPFSIAMYYILQSWQVLEPLIPLHLEKVISGVSKTIYASAAAIGGITITSEEPRDYVLLGRTFERLWLTVTKVGLSFQPLNGVPFLKLKIDSNEETDLSAPQRELVETGYKTAQKTFGAEGRRLACMFRLGGGAQPRGHSSQRELSEIVTVV